jgi:hypothetical protein
MSDEIEVKEDSFFFGDDPKRFQEQCFFLDNLDFFLKDLTKIGYNNFVKMNLGEKEDTSSFFNKISVPKGTEKFLNITPAQASTLVPNIRIFKVYYSDAKSKGEDYELLFNNYLTETALKSITSSRSGRGAGAGIKSFSWENKGENQATANRIFESKLELYFQDFSALTSKQRAISPDGKRAKSFSFLDLVIPSENYNSKVPNSKEWNKDYYRIKIAVGWSIPNEKLAASGVSFSKDEKAAIAATGKVFFLNLLSHEINFNPDGQITLSISYIGGTESVIGAPDTNVLALKRGDEYEKRVEAAKKELEKTRRLKKLISSDKCDNTDKEKESRESARASAEVEDKKKLKNAQKEANLKRYETFVKYLYSQANRMRYIDVPFEVLQKYVQENGDADESANISAQPITTDLEKIKTAGGAGTLDVFDIPGGDAIVKAARESAEGETDKAKETSQQVVGPADANVQRMIYTTFGNIIETALYALNRDSSREEIRTIVGTISIPNPRTGVSQVVNVADLPVSYKMFSTWFYNVCISKNLKQWRFKKFLHEASQTLFRSVVKAKCFDDDDISGLGDLDLKIETIDLPRRSNGSDPFFPNYKGTDAGAWNKKDVSNGIYKPVRIEGLDDPTKDYNPEETDIFSYLIMYGKQTRPDRFHYGNGRDRQTEDNNKKVYHFSVGKNQGLVKNINFSKTDIPYAKESRLIASKNENSSILALREVYDVNITLYGSTMWTPGSLIYVDVSSQLGGTDTAEKMGLQAYYRVVSTSSFIENGKYETTIVGKYEFSGNKKIDSSQASEGAEECATLDNEKYKTKAPPSTTGGIEVIERQGGRTGGGSSGIR